MIKELSFPNVELRDFRWHQVCYSYIVFRNGRTSQSEFIRFNRNRKIRAVPIEKFRIFFGSGFPRFDREFSGRFQLKSSVFSGFGFPRFDREFSGRFQLNNSVFSGFYRFNREFSGPVRLKSSGFSRFNREFSGRFQLKSSVFSGFGFSRFNRKIYGRSWRLLRLSSSGYLVPVEPVNRVPKLYYFFNNQK